MTRLIDAFEQILDGSGDPVVEGLIDFFESGSSSARKTTFADSAQTIANSNPVVLGGDGRCPNVFGTGSYNAILRTSAGVQIVARDPVGQGGGLAFGEDWSVTTSYSATDQVRDAGLYWQSLVSANLGNQPSLDSGAKWVKTDFKQIIVNTASIVTNANAITANTNAIALAPSIATSQYFGTPVGGTIALPTNLSGIVAPPKDNANFRYILLTAGESGTGEYNETILTSETVSGSAPLLVATAVINLSSSPINGLTVNLINSEGRFIKPGTSSGTVANDQMQQITGSETGSFGISFSESSQVTSSGALTLSNFANSSFNVGGTGSNRAGTRSFDSANSANARTGTSTDVKNIQHTYYMRIA